MTIFSIVRLGSGLLRAEHDDGEAGSTPGAGTPTVEYVLPPCPDLDLASLAMPSNAADVGEQAELTVSPRLAGRSSTSAHARSGPSAPQPPPTTRSRWTRSVAGRARRRGRDKWRIVHPSVVPLLQPGDLSASSSTPRSPSQRRAAPGPLPDAGPRRRGGRLAVTARSGVAQAQAGWIRPIGGDRST